MACHHDSNKKWGHIIKRASLSEDRSKSLDATTNMPAYRLSRVSRRRYQSITNDLPTLECKTRCCQLTLYSTILAGIHTGQANEKTRKIPPPNPQGRNQFRPLWYISANSSGRFHRSLSTQSITACSRAQTIDVCCPEHVTWPKRTHFHNNLPCLLFYSLLALIDHGCRRP